MKKVSLWYTIIIIFFSSLFFARFVFSQTSLEVIYPTIPFATPPASPDVPLSLYLKYIYNLSIYLAGFLVFVLIVWGGIRYIFSVGNPSRMAEAKEQIQKALLGLLIIFSAYLILNTLNPQLVLFPLLSLTPIEEIPLPDIEPAIETVWRFREIPIGSMITSEITPSSFIYAFFDLIPTTTDPDTSLDNYASISVCTTTNLFYIARYQEDPNATTTQYQGALEGRRLKRIHEVTTTTLPAFERIADLSEQFAKLMEEFRKHIDDLYHYVKKCDCKNCETTACPGNSDCKCNFCQCLDTRHPCPGKVRDKLNELKDKILPAYYKDPTDPINCKIYMMKYLAEHIRRFLNSDVERPLVKNDDYRDDSYWYSPEAEELRNKIKACIDASPHWENWIKTPLRGADLEEIFEKIEEVIWKNTTTSLAAVENKGTHSPKTDPPQRDVQTNLDHLEDQLNYLLEMRNFLNPHYTQPMSQTQLGALKTIMETRLDVKIEKLSFPLRNNAILISADDPAIFYSYPSPLTPISIPESKRSFFSDNFVFAKELKIQEPGAQEVMRVTCDRIVEIPIGKAMDEAIKLIRDIVRELRNVKNKGNRIIDKVLEQGKLASTTVGVLVPGLLSLTTKDACKCSKNCTPGCEKEYYDCHCDDRGNCKTCCRCECTCIGNACPLKDILKKYNKIKLNGTIRKLAFEIKALLGEPDQEVIVADGINIYESYFRLNSVYPDGHPKTGEKVPINHDLCCTADDANCRDKDGNLQLDKIEEKNYTLIEKLIEVQKLLNYSRREENFKTLIDALLEIEKSRTKYTDIDLADEKEKDNAYREQKVGEVAIGGEYSLTRCRMLYADIKKYIEKKQAASYLENCRMAKLALHIKRETCNRYDPPYDCDYFNFRINRKRTPLNCYCYDEVWYLEHINNITSNFFCCIIQP
ncbi:MAG: pilin [Candidatus Pacebacteria bacterium]|nr:pilin [Candidatus Paceibacterota bacterium]